MKETDYNVVILGVSCFDGMASSTRVRNLMEPLVSSNRITACNLVYASDARGLQENKGTINGISYEVIGFKKSNPLTLLSFYYNCFAYLRKHKSATKKNILYNFQQIDIKNLPIISYAKSIGYKVVIDLVEDNAFYIQFADLFNRIKLKSSVFFLNISPKMVNAIVAISSHLYKKMEAISKGQVPVHLIPISVDLNFFKSPVVQKDTDEIKLFYGGSFGIKDGLEYLIEAFDVLNEEFSNLKLIFSGRGSVVDYSRFQKLVADAKYSHNIIVKGFLETEEYYDLLNSCDIFCMTRVDSKFANAGFPFKLGGFLATRKPVVTTVVGDIPVYLTDHLNALLIKPESTPELVEALRYLITNPDKRKLLGDNGRKVVEEHFAADLVSNNLFDIFTQV